MNLRRRPEVIAARKSLESDAGEPLKLLCDLANALVCDLAHNLDMARDLDLIGDLLRSIDFAHARARAHASDLICGSIHAGNLVQAGKRANTLARNLTRDIVRTRSLGLARARELTCVRSCARDRSRDLARVLAFSNDLDQRHIVEIRTAELGRVITRLLRREPLQLDRDALQTLLDDFTTADMSYAHLAGVDLAGVQWSEHTTRWPSTIDPEELKARSAETQLDSGTWTVR